jgi:DNA end-binding protein Ku
MARAGQIGIGRVVMSSRERIVALEPRGKGILAYTLRTDAEVRKEDEIFGGISDKDPDPQMIAIAQKIIEQQEGPFDPSQFVDRYEEALKDLIAAKQKGHKVAKVEEPEDTNVIDLMAALRASLSAKVAPAAKASSKAGAKTKAAEKPAAKTKAKAAAKTAHKKAS